VPGQLSELQRLFGQSEQLLGGQQGLFDQDILPLLQELSRTGLRTDTAGIREAALRGFERETVPLALEQLSGDFGLRSTGTRNLLVEQGRDLEADLAGIEFEASELANQRRAGAPGLFQNILGQQFGQQGQLFGQQQGLFGSQLAGAGGLGQVAGLLQQLDPSNRLLQAFLQLSSGGGAVPFQPGSPSPNVSAGNAGAVAGGAGALITAVCWIAAELYGWNSIERMLARGFIINWSERSVVGNVVRKLYTRFGERIAVASRTHPWLRKLCKVFIGWAVANGRREFAYGNYT
ncbi:hypothetical protein LCGC14_2843690, partial [marine sediment metagenome]